MTDLLALPLREAPMTFFDLETTGLELGLGHRVCEIAMLRTRGGATEGLIDSLVWPDRALDPQAAAVNGLGEAILAGAPRFELLAPRVEALIDGAVLVAHNLAFDLAFLGAELRRAGRALDTGPQLDTLILTRRLIRQPSYSLGALARALGLETPTHRAMSDVRALHGLFSHLVGLMEGLGVVTVGDAVRLERGLPPGTPDPEPPPLIARALAEGQLLRIVYSSRSTPEPTTRIVRPHYLVREGSVVYLRAFCHLRNDVRNFAIEKIQLIELFDSPLSAKL